MQQCLVSTLADCGVKIEGFSEFLVKNSVVTVSDFVLAARSNKQYIDTDIIDACGIAQLSLAQKIAIRKAWEASEVIVLKRKTAATAAASSAQLMAISVDDAKCLHDAFKNRHRFGMPGRRLLSEALQGKLLAQYNTRPKTFAVILPELLRIRSGVENTPAGHSLHFMPGQQATSSSDALPEEVTDAVILWKRLRALVCTLSFISIQSPNWLEYDVADEFADKCLEWMNTKYNKVRLPLSFFVQAYVSTFTFFFDQVHQTDATLSSLIKDEASYRSFWTQYSGPVIRDVPEKGKAEGNASGSFTQPDNDSMVTREMQKMRAMQDRLHAKIDKFASSRREPSPGTVDKRRQQSERDKANNHYGNKPGKANLAANPQHKRQRDNWDNSDRGDRGRDRRR